MWIRARIKVFVLRLPFVALAGRCQLRRRSLVVLFAGSYRYFFEGSSLYIEPTDHPIPTYGLGRQRRVGTTFAGSESFRAALAVVLLYNSHSL